MSSENPSSHYKPGSCNIGQKELAVRKKFLSVFLPITLFLSFGAFYWDTCLTLWICLLGSAFCTIVLFLEIKFKFCILFGIFSLYNFDRLGMLHESKKAVDQSKDRKRVVEICIQSMLFALIYSIGIHLLASFVHS